MSWIKQFGILIMVVVALASCDDDESTPREKTYHIYQANYNPVKGDVVFTELEPGKMKVVISLKNTGDGINYPAHLHFGSVSEVGELAFRLNDVEGSTGKSVTILDQVDLSNGELFTYDLLDEMNGSVKIHMTETYFKNMVLASGNIGKNQDYVFGGVAVCTGH